MGGGAHYPYPKYVWSPAGGWWCNPRGWKGNTVTAGIIAVALCVPVFMYSAANERRPVPPRTHIPSQRWCKHAKKKGRGYLYEEHEDDWIIETVLSRCEDGNSVRLGGRAFWMEIATDQPGPTKRTWESIKARYLALIRKMSGDPNANYEDAYMCDHGDGQYPVPPVKKTPTSSPRKTRDSGSGRKTKDPQYNFKGSLPSEASQGSPSRKSPSRRAKTKAVKKMAPHVLEDSGDDDGEQSDKEPKVESSDEEEEEVSPGRPLNSKRKPRMAALDEDTDVNNDLFSDDERAAPMSSGGGGDVEVDTAWRAKAFEMTLGAFLAAVAAYLAFLKLG